jgi:voltage-gated potassium channel
MVAVVVLAGLVLGFWRTLRTDTELRGLFYLVGVLLVSGALFYWRVEGWSFFDALYVSLVTLATVGYGDLAPRTVAGKAFTMVYIVVGIGLLFGVINRAAEDRIRLRADRLRRRADPRTGRARGGDDADGGPEERSPV